MVYGSNVKISIIGLDGVPPEILSGIVETESKKLKFLYQVLQSYGVHELTSVVPYISPAAWISMFTGVYPVVHGVYDFFKLVFKDHTYELKPISIFDVKAEFVWDILGRYGYKSMVANIPSLYPAKKINGIMISGPPNTTLTTYPSYLKQILKRRYGYEVDIEDFNFNFLRNKECTLKKIIDIESKRIKPFIFLTRTFNKCSLYIYGFSFTDNILHFSIIDVMEYLNGKKSKVPEEYHVLIRVLEDIDRMLCMLHEIMDVIILVSDHGMRPYENMFLINSWLIRQGYLSLKNVGSLIEIDKLLNNKHFYKVYRLISRLLPSLKRMLNNRVKKISKDRFDPSMIDLSNTIMFAYNSNMPVSLIKIHNVSTKENLKDIRNELSRELIKEIDCIVCSIEDVYGHEFNLNNERSCEVNHPDLLVISRSCVFSALRLHNAIITSLERKGDHDIRGFITYISNKKDIELNVNKAKVVDIAPTIVNLILNDTEKELRRFNGKSLLR